MVASFTPPAQSVSRASATPHRRWADVTATNYLIDHTGTLTVVDRQGYTRLVFPFGVAAEDMASDLRYLLSR
jgi:cytochrome oxidase Cu insertion factor (SCO1/SenC/PrrC family)